MITKLPFSRNYILDSYFLFVACIIKYAHPLSGGVDTFGDDKFANGTYSLTGSDVGPALYRE